MRRASPWCSSVCHVRSPRNPPKAMPRMRASTRSWRRRASLRQCRSRILIATAPGLEQQAPAAQFGFNFLAPFTYNSNAEEIRTGGTPTLELSPVGNLSFAAPLFGLPVRLSANAVVENDRFVSSRGADLDKIGGSLRFQYVDPNNDQGFSPYVAYAPRFDFLPTFSEEVATRQDVNLGFNKRFNLDGNFQSVPFAGNTAALTVWSFGLTIFGQRRFRDPTPSSSALFFVPSVSYVISEQWNASLAVEVIGRWFDSNVRVFPAGIGKRNRSRRSNISFQLSCSVLLKQRIFSAALHWISRHLSTETGRTCRSEIIINGRRAPSSRRAGAFDQRLRPICRCPASRFDALLRRCEQSYNLAIAKAAAGCVTLISAIPREGPHLGPVHDESKTRRRPHIVVLAGDRPFACWLQAGDKDRGPATASGSDSDRRKKRDRPIGGAHRADSGGERDGSRLSHRRPDHRTIRRRRRSCRTRSGAGETRPAK